MENKSLFAVGGGEGLNRIEKRGDGEHVEEGLKWGRN